MALLPALLAGATTTTAALTNCGLIGPVYPVPVDYASTQTIKDTQCAFSKLMREITRTSSTDWGPIDLDDTSFSFAVFSTRSDGFLFEHHHQGRGAGMNGTVVGGHLDAGTLYRIGSISKVLTVYTILEKLGPGVWSEPVTKYVPELAGAAGGSAVRWGEITLGDLAGQLSGISRNIVLEDLSLIPGVDQVLGVTLNRTEVPACGYVGQRPCSREEFFQYLLARHPVAAAGETPIYSNIAFAILAMAYESKTGKSLRSAFESAIAEPLGLRRSFWSAPSNYSNVMAVNQPAGPPWDYDLGAQNPSGGAYMSLGDLASLGRSIMRSSLLPPATTRSWLKPLTHTAITHSAVGRPWEILRMDVPIAAGSATTRVVDLYTKSGGIGSYSAWLVLSPDHDVGVAIYSASVSPSGGGPATLLSLGEQLLATWIPAAEAAARENAAAKFAGRYVGSGDNSSLTLEVLPDRQGMAITEFMFNGRNMLDNLRLLGATSGNLQYMNLEAGGKMAFRAVWQGDVAPAGRPKVLTTPCAFTWSGMDSPTFGGIAIDEFLFDADERGTALGVTVPFLRAGTWMKA